MYLALKITHIVAIISWMAGILYLYRLLIYDVERGQVSQEIHDLLGLMQKRLYYGITLPAMTVGFITGITLIVMQPELMKQGWLHTKLLAVILLKVATIYAGITHKKLKAGEFASYTSKRLRILNEIPTLLMIIIVTMVVARPF